MNMKMKGKGLTNFRKNWLFYALALPGVIFLGMFCYAPMAGLYIVFERYTFDGGLFGSEFVGLKNFEFFFRNINNALRATRNTLVINGVAIVLGIITLVKKYDGKGMAIAGLVTAGIGIVIFIICIGISAAMPYEEILDEIVNEMY